MMMIKWLRNRRIANLEKRLVCIEAQYTEYVRIEGQSDFVADAGVDWAIETRGEIAQIVHDIALLNNK